MEQFRKKKGLHAHEQNINNNNNNCYFTDYTATCNQTRKQNSQTQQFNLESIMAVTAQCHIREQTKNHNPNLIFIKHDFIFAHLLSPVGTSACAYYDFPSNNTETRLESEGNKTVGCDNRIRNSAKQKKTHTHKKRNKY